MRLATVSLLCVISASPARADFRTDQANQKLAAAEAKLDGFAKPTWFDSKQITGSPELRAVVASSRECSDVQHFAADTFNMLAPTFQQTPRGAEVARRANELGKYCDALAAALDGYKKVVAANEAKANAERAAADASAKAAKQAAAADEAERQKRVKAMIADMGDGVGFINDYAHVYDSKFYSYGLQDSAAVIKQAKERAKLALAACKKHMPLADPTRIPSRGDSIYITDYPVEACYVAEHSDELIQKARMGFAMMTLDVKQTTLRLETAKILEGSLKSIPETVQQRLFDKDKWVAAMNKEVEPRFKEKDLTIPADAWDPAFAKDADVKALIDKAGTTDRFDMPPNKDAAAEKVAKAGFAKQLPGAKIKKIGTSYAKWEAYDEKTWVGSDDKYDYYRVNAGKNKYKRGWALLEIPGRPYCQAREWIVFRIYNGPIKLDWIAQDGVFVKCD